MSARWVLVTGAGQRLGREIALAFARARWNVVCHYQTSAQEAAQTCRDIEQLGGQGVAIGADLRVEVERENAFRGALEASGGRLDAVVNNASMFQPDSGMDMSTALLTEQLQVNLVAPLHLGSLLARHAREQRAGPRAAIVQVLDQKVFNLNPDYFSYTVTKLALERTVALQAQALAPYVRVTAIAPGLVYLSGPQSADNFELAGKANLLRSPTDPEDVARTAVFLAENESITGVTVCVDKGQHLVPLERDVMFVVDAVFKGKT